MRVIVTGGAGFIGSCLIRMLNDKGIDNIIIVDNIASTDKWKNLINKKYSSYVHKTDFLERLERGDFDKVDFIFHLGACSSTTETNFDYLYNNNFEYTKRLWRYCANNGTSFLYASSAATYGDGSQGFDDKEDISSLQPLNGYGYSKQLFDIWVEKEIAAHHSTPPQHAGFKFFNVYGPNEYYKDSMASVIMHGFKQVKETGRIGLFKSYNPSYEDGGQLRDFVYVKDICSVFEFFMQHPDKSGLFNVGTGHAESFRTLGESVFKALNMAPAIDYIEMPESLRPKYQYYTEADMSKLREIGYDKTFYSLETGAIDYVQNYLDKGFLTY